MFYLLLATYGTVFLAELLGDKSVYTISSLTLRFRVLYVFCGFSVAFMIKMFAAVLLGQMIAQLPRPLVAAISTVTFLVTAFVLWFRKKQEKLRNNLTLFSAFSMSVSRFLSRSRSVTKLTASANFSTPLPIPNCSTK